MTRSPIELSWTAKNTVKYLNIILRVAPPLAFPNDQRKVLQSPNGVAGKVAQVLASAIIQLNKTTPHRWGKQGYLGKILINQTSPNIKAKGKRDAAIFCFNFVICTGA